MTNKELFDFVDETVAYIVNRRNGRNKKVRLVYEIEKAPYNAVRICLKLRMAKTVKDDDGNRREEVSYLFLRRETVYAIQGYEIIEEKLWKSFNVYQVRDYYY